MNLTPWVNRPAPMLGQHAGATWEAESAEQPVTRRAGPKPLSGIRVLDFTNAVAGPIASFILADLGAEVIKIEAPTSRPKQAAGTAPLLEGAEAPSYNRIMLFNELNHGKRSLALDVAKPQGRDIFLRLAETADVVVQELRAARRGQPRHRLRGSLVPQPEDRDGLDARAGAFRATARPHLLRPRHRCDERPEPPLRLR
jgi:hypothetical protein